MANANHKNNDSADQDIDIKNLIYKFLDNWRLFAICVVLALAACFLYNRYKTNVYQATGTVLINSDQSRFDPTALMTGISYGNQQNLENEMAIMKSYALTERVVKNMNLEVSYWEKGRVASTELYKTAPFDVEFDRSFPQAVGLVYYVSILDSGRIELKANDDFCKIYDFILCQTVKRQDEDIKLDSVYQQGEWIDNGYNRMRVVLNDRYNSKTDGDRKLMFMLNDYTSLTRKMRSFSINPSSKQSSIASVVTTGTNPLKITEFTNSLMNEYVTSGLEKKNKVSENTINFIDRQLSEIQDSLHNAEINLQDYRSSNDLMNLDAQAQQIYMNLQALEKDRAEIDVNLKLYQRLQKYIQMQIEDPENLAAPSTMGINDQLLNKLVLDLVTLSQTRAAQVASLSEQHPNIIKLDEQIVTLKKTLLESANNLVSNAQVSLAEIDKRIAKVEAESRNLPHKQRELMGYQRKFALNEDTYNYLMQRRAEAQILRASNTPDNEIIDVARIEQVVKIAPRSTLNYLIALLLGLLLPALYLFLKEFFNVTINDKKDVEKLTKNPIIGQIAQNESSSPLVVLEAPKSSIAEAFRLIRTNIEFITQNQTPSVILVTSDTQGVGKSFNSMNIASVYALFGKKTILLGFDMRKPKIYEEFGLSNNIGLSSYLSNKENLEQIIQPSGKVQNLDIITSGPIPPNPAELIASEKCNLLIQELKQRYDYIIIDTPPLGLVTDAYLLMKHSNVNLFIVRQGETNKNFFGNIIKDIEDRNIPVNIIINGIKMQSDYGPYKSRYGQHYGYRYGYGYSYGAYSRYGMSYYGENEVKGKRRKRGK